jgi:hypothetical protein
MIPGVEEVEDLLNTELNSSFIYLDVGNVNREIW